MSTELSTLLVLSGPLLALAPWTVTVPRVRVESSVLPVSASAEDSGLRANRPMDSKGHSGRDTETRFARGKVIRAGITHHS